ncbi:MAG: DUF4831 family protein [Bacteroides sp.]|nr:DUF4831 family protein [Bacteroides sp.]
MNIRHLIIMLPALLCASLTLSAQSTQRFSAGKSNEYGLSYSLPVTVFEVTVAAERTEATPGEFRLYARKYLNLDPILEPSVRWTLTGADVVPAARQSADDDESRYLVQFKSGSTPFMMLTPEGFPVTVNDADFNPAPAAASKLAAVAPQPTILESPAARQAVTEEMLRSHSVAKRAELAAARIYEIRQTRSDILSGQADAMPADGAAMKLVLDNLEQQEAALTAMFTGTLKKSTEVASFTVTPPSADATWRYVVARLSAINGIVDPDDLTGAPIFIDFSDITSPTLPVNEKGQPKSFPKNGLAYRIPGTATVTLTYDGRTLDRLARADVAQYGVVFGLDPSLFTDKKAPSYVRFNPLTGAVTELDLIRKPTADN